MKGFTTCLVLAAAAVSHVTAAPAEFNTRDRALIDTRTATETAVNIAERDVIPAYSIPSKRVADAPTDTGNVTFNNGTFTVTYANGTSANVTVGELSNTRDGIAGSIIGTIGGAIFKSIMKKIL